MKANICFRKRHLAAFWRVDLAPHDLAQIVEWLLRGAEMVFFFVVSM